MSQEGAITIGDKKPSGPDVLPLIGYAPALHPKNLGDPQFKAFHNLRYAYVVGAMANGITSADMVEEAGRDGMMGFFGAAGLLPDDHVVSVTRNLESPRGAQFHALLILFRLRARTAFLGALSLANYSEFGLIVGAIGVREGMLGTYWLSVLAIALSISFLIAAMTQIGSTISL